MPRIYSNPPPEAGALTPLVLNLNPAADGRQRISDPDGNFAGTPLEKPFNLRSTDKTSSTLGVAWDYNDQGQTGFQIRTWISGVDNAWQDKGTVGPNTRGYVLTGLPANTNVGFQVKANA